MGWEFKLEHTIQVMALEECPHPLSLQTVATSVNRGQLHQNPLTKRMAPHVIMMIPSPQSKILSSSPVSSSMSAPEQTEDSPDQETTANEHEENPNGLHQSRGLLVWSYSLEVKPLPFINRHALSSSSLPAPPQYHGEHSGAGYPHYASYGE